MTFLTSAIAHIREMWRNLSAGQRTLVSIIALAIVLLTVCGSVLSVSVPMVAIAGPETDDQDRKAIVEALHSRGHTHEIRNGSIYVPRRNADEVLVHLASSGIDSDQVFQKFLGETTVMESQWEKDKRYQIALQKRLETLIRRVESVNNAGVLLTPRSRAPIVFRGSPKPSASVQVELRNGKSLTRENTVAIAGLVAGSVPGLSRDMVHVMDTAGRSYPIPREGEAALDRFGHRDLERSIEHEIERDLEEFWPGLRAIVRVVARSTRIRVRSVNHEQGVSVYERETERVKKRDALGAPIPLKGSEYSADPPPAFGSAPTLEKDSQREAKHRPSQIVVDEENPGGQIESITAVVRWPVLADENGEMDPKILAWLPKVERGVHDAIGTTAVVKSLTVIPFPMQAPTPLPPSSLFTTIWEATSDHGATVLLLLMTSLGLFFIYRIMKGSLPSKTLDEEVRAIRERMNSELVADLDQKGPQLSEVERTKQGIREMLASNPSGGGAVVTRWLQEK